MSIVIKNISNVIHTAGARKWTTRPLSKIKLIAVHHEGGAVRSDSYDEIEAINQMAIYHISKNWGSTESPAYAPTTPYHYCIGRSGEIYQMNDLKNITWHANNANDISLAILLQGNFEKQDPTSQQIISLNNLLKHLISDEQGLNIGYSDVWGHSELKGRIMSLKYGKITDFANYTVCPASALRYVQEFRATGSIKNIPKSAEDKPDEIGGFIDLKDGEWYTPFAKTMIEAGVMRGYDDKTWRPAEKVTRAEISKIVIGSMLKMDEILKIYKDQDS